MTYDNSQGIERLANQHGLETDLVSMKNTHNTDMKELLIGRTLTRINQINLK